MSQLFPNSGFHEDLFPGQVLDYFRSENNVSRTNFLPPGDHFVGGMDWTTVMGNPDEILYLKADIICSASVILRYVTGEWFVNGVKIHEQVHTLGETPSNWQNIQFRASYRIPSGTSVSAAVRFNMRYEDVGATLTNRPGTNVHYQRVYMPRANGVEDTGPFGYP